MRRALTLALALVGGSAFAHSGTGLSGTGVALSTLTHGQMAVIARHAPAILDMAARVPAPDEPFRRVLNYARIQKAYCGWGLVPGSVTDEASPFNECSHAWLAAARDLLVRMGSLPDVPVGALSGAVERAMLDEGAALVLCKFSAEGFDTGSIVKPDPMAMIRHPASAFSVLALLMVLAAAGFGMARFLTTSPRPVREG